MASNKMNKSCAKHGDEFCSDCNFYSVLPKCAHNKLQDDCNFCWYSIQPKCRHGRAFSLCDCRWDTPKNFCLLHKGFADACIECECLPKCPHGLNAGSCFSCWCAMTPANPEFV